MTNKAPLLSKSPKPDSPEFMAWLDEIRFRMNNRILSESFAPRPLGTGTATLHGKHSGVQVESGETAYFEIIIPWSLRIYKAVGIRIIPTTTGDMDYTVNLSYGQPGEDENLNTATLSATNYVTTDDQIQEIDITSLFSDQDGGEQVGVEFTVDGFTTTTNVYVLSLYLKYI